MLLHTTGPVNQKVSEVGFLVLLLLMVVLQFLIFYFWLPKLTQSLPKEEEAVVTQTQT